MKKLAVTLILIFLVLVAIHFLLAPKSGEFLVEDLYDSILSRGKIKVGLNPNTKPFCYKNQKDEYVGYDVDLARYIAEYIFKDKNKYEVVEVTASNRLLKASTGEADIVISTVTITPQREQIVSFSNPYDIAGQAILVKTNSSISSMADLNGLNVGVVFGTTAEKNMRNLVPNTNLLGFKSYQDAYLALKDGRINAITSDDVILKRFATNDSSVKLLPKRYSKEPYGIAFKKGASTNKLKEHLDFLIGDLQSKNVISKLRKTWGIE